ncbi:MAG: hypothetical protein OQJ97_10660 [Rhodospirillales bacterium]|nr:hypothetical protein [Rhodospirillales bacterium]
MMKTPFFRLFAALLFTLTVSACQTAPPPQMPTLSYSHLPALNLAVSQVEIGSEYKAPMIAPNKEHTLATSPSMAFTQWVNDRVRTQGQGGMAKFVVEEASVIETALNRTKGVKGLFTKDQAERYNGTLKGRVEIYNSSGKKLGYATASATRSQTVGEGINLNERERILFELVEALVADFGTALEKNMRSYLTDWVR